MAMKCRLCGKDATEIRGYLARMNELGVNGIWECRPSCDADLSLEERLVAAIEGDEPTPIPYTPTSAAFETLRQSLRDDADHAGGWHDNLACAAMDEGIDSPTANRIATRFMKMCFGVDTKRR